MSDTNGFYFYLLRADDDQDSLGVIAVPASDSDRLLECGIKDAVTSMLKESASFGVPVVFKNGMDDDTGFCGWVEETRFNKTIYWSIFFVGQGQPNSLVLY